MHVADAADAHEPALQLTHVLLAACVEYVPALHDTQAVLPVDPEYCPALQFTQVAELVACVAMENVPAAHWLQVLELELDHVPAEQLVQVPAPKPDQ